MKEINKIYSNEMLTFFKVNFLLSFCFSQIFRYPPFAVSSITIILPYFHGLIFNRTKLIHERKLIQKYEMK